MQHLGCGTFLPEEYRFTVWRVELKVLLNLVENGRYPQRRLNVQIYGLLLAGIEIEEHCEKRAFNERAIENKPIERKYNDETITHASMHGSCGIAAIWL